MKMSSTNEAKPVNLEKSTEVELKELLNRQNKLLSNKRFILSLADKGERIFIFKSKIEEELRRRSSSLDEATERLSHLKLQSFPNEVEWATSNSHKEDTKRDSDDDSDCEVDPLKLVATHSGTQFSYVRKKDVKSSLVTEQDEEEAKSFSTNPTEYAQKFCRKYDGNQTKGRFKPCQPKQVELANSSFKSSSENVQKRLGKNWEVTAATPPIPIHNSVAEVSLTESLELQRTQAAKLKEIEMKDAMLRLKNAGNNSFSSLPTKNLMSYREPRDPSSLFDGTPTREHNNDDENELGFNTEDSIR